MNTRLPAENIKTSATLIENPPYKQEVAGSSPALPTNHLPKLRNRFELVGSIAKVFCHDSSGQIHTVLIDADQLARVIRFGFWRIFNASKNPDLPLYYAKSRHLFMHRLLCKPSPVGLEVDHWNQNSLDNRTANLRPGGHSQNQLNRRRHDKMCVYKRGNRFQVRIEINQVQRCIGSFKTEETAKQARDAFLRSRGVCI
jgi:hypothetical protein